MNATSMTSSMNTTQARLQLAGVNFGSLLRQHTKAFDHATEVGGKPYSHNLVRPRRSRQLKKIAAARLATGEFENASKANSGRWE